jgi:dGTPase
VRFWEVQRQIMNFLIGGLIDGTLRAAEAAGVETVDDVRSLDYRLARFTPEAAEINRQLKGMLVSHVYADVQLMEDRGAYVVKLGDLFDYLVKHPECMSSGYREHLETTPVHRVVCDYIAGMTDAYFTRIYRELLG